MIREILAACLVVVALFAVGQMDHEDELLAAGTYCAEVAAGTWPDYKGYAAAGWCDE